MAQNKTGFGGQSGGPDFASLLGHRSVSLVTGCAQLLPLLLPEFAAKSSCGAAAHSTQSQRAARDAAMDDRLKPAAIYIQGLPTSIGNIQVEDICKKAGKIKKIKV